VEPTAFGEASNAAHAGGSHLRLLIARWLHLNAAQRPSAKR
jgi:hypothetical protein